MGKAHLVPETGLEPAHVAIPDPKSGASANFATPAFWACKTLNYVIIVAYGTFPALLYLLIGCCRSYLLP